MCIRSCGPPAGSKRCSALKRTAVSGQRSARGDREHCLRGDRQAMALDPWYRVAQPREEVREGRSFNPDEFAIALEQVVAGTAPADYRDPEAFWVRLFFVEEFSPYSWAFLPADASLQCSFRGDSCCRARGTDRNWTRVDRKMSWSPAASSSQQRARVLTDVKARRFAPPPLRGADGLDAGSAHARPDWLLPTMLTHTPPTCCGRRPVQNDALSGDR